MVIIIGNGIGDPSSNLNDANKKLKILDNNRIESKKGGRNSRWLDPKLIHLKRVYTFTVQFDFTVT